MTRLARYSIPLLLVVFCTKSIASGYSIASLADITLVRTDRTSQVTHIQAVDSNPFGSIANAGVSGFPRVLVKRPGDDQPWRQLPGVNGYAAGARAFADQLRVFFNDCKLLVLPRDSGVLSAAWPGTYCDNAAFLSDKSLIVVPRKNEVAAMRRLGPSGEILWQSIDFPERADRISRTQLIVDEPLGRVTVVRVASDDDGSIKTRFERFSLATGTLLVSYTLPVYVSSDAVMLSADELLVGEHSSDGIARVLRLNLTTGETSQIELSVADSPTSTAVTQLCRINSTSLVARQGRTIYQLDVHGDARQVSQDFGYIPESPDSVICVAEHAYLIGVNLAESAGSAALWRLAADGTSTRVLQTTLSCYVDIAPAALMSDQADSVTLLAQVPDAQSCDHETRTYTLEAHTLRGATVTTRTHDVGITSVPHEIRSFRLGRDSIGMQIADSRGQTAAVYRSSDHTIRYRTLDRPLGHGGQGQGSTVSIDAGGNYVACGVDRINLQTNVLHIEVGNIETGPGLRKRIELSTNDYGNDPSLCFAHPSGVEWVGSWRHEPSSLRHLSFDRNGVVAVRPDISFPNHFATLLPNAAENGPVTDSGFVVVESSGDLQRMVRVATDGSTKWQSSAPDLRWVRLLPSGVVAFAGRWSWGFVDSHGATTVNPASAGEILRVPANEFGLVVRHGFGELRYDDTGTLLATDSVAWPLSQLTLWRSPRFAVHTASLPAPYPETRLMLTDLLDPTVSYALPLNEIHQVLEPRFELIESGSSIALVGTARLFGEPNERRLFVADLQQSSPDVARSLEARIAARTQIACMSHAGLCAVERYSGDSEFVW